MQYQNFDLDVFDHKVTESGERFGVRASSQAGEQRIAGADRVSLPVRVRQSIGALRRRRLTLREMIALGEELGKALFPPASAVCWTQACCACAATEKASASGSSWIPMPWPSFRGSMSISRRLIRPKIAGDPKVFLPFSAVSRWCGMRSWGSRW